MSDAAYILLAQSEEGGKPVFLQVGGDNDGWWMDEARQRVRQAAQDELDAAKRRFWNL